MFNIGDKVYWNDPDNDISSGEYWVVGKNGEVLTLKDSTTEVEALEDECIAIL